MNILIKGLIGVHLPLDCRTSYLEKHNLFIFNSFGTMTYGRQVSNAKVYIDGTSNLHDWTTEANSPVVRGTFRLVFMDQV